MKLPNMELQRYSQQNVSFWYDFEDIDEKIDLKNILPQYYFDSKIIENR